MDQIERLAKLSVLRASGFAGIPILLTMMGAASNPAISFLFGALLLAVLAVSMALYAVWYHLRPRIEETEVWIMLPERDRPNVVIARPLIINAMREQLLEKSGWWARLASLFLVAAIALILTQLIA